MSSSDSEEDTLFLIENSFLKIMNPRIGVHPINRDRKKFGEYHHLFHALKNDEERFFQYLRMRRTTFEYILHKIEMELKKTWTNWHQQPILPEERLVVTLRYLATGTSFKSLSFSFRMGASTVGKVIAETVEVLWKVLQPLHMPAPTTEMFEKISEDFYNLWNFPHVLGAIDGKHIRVLCPKNSGSMYFNYKKYFSIVLQRVADANYRFSIIDVGGYGKQSDGGTFQASELYAWLNAKELGIPQPRELPNSNVKAPFVFIGDDAYPLLDCLIKPFKGTSLPFEKEYFNKRLSRARKTVECAFGILNAKWRLLSKCIETDVNLAETIVKCVCVLQNTVIDKEGFERHLNEALNLDNTSLVRATMGRPPNSAAMIRDVFFRYICSNPIVFTCNNV